MIKIGGGLARLAKAGLFLSEFGVFVGGKVTLMAARAEFCFSEAVWGVANTEMQSRSYQSPSSCTLDRVCLQHRPHCASSPPAQTNPTSTNTCQAQQWHLQRQHFPHKSHELSRGGFVFCPAAAMYWFVWFYWEIRLWVAVTPAVGAGCCCCASRYSKPQFCLR